MLVLVNNATRFTVAIYQVKRKDLKNVEKMMKVAIANTLFSMNLNPELVNEYMRLAGELEFVRNNSRLGLVPNKEDLEYDESAVLMEGYTLTEFFPSISKCYIPMTWGVTGNISFSLLE